MVSKIMVCGSRTWKDEQCIHHYLEKVFILTEGCFVIIHGGARGADQIAADWAKQRKNVYTKIVEPIKPDNPSYYLHRNVEMITEADKIFAFWDGKSRGTKFVIDYAKARGKHIEVIRE